jgi:23S rRNA (uridine2552-2'-O)-methyltransferase
VALDILPMTPLTGVHFIQGDFREDEVLDELNNVLNGQQIDLVLSDMAPNMSGMDSIDQPASMYLVELALDFAVKNLSKNGAFLVKVFQGEGFDAFLKDMRNSFVKVTTRKPEASRARSRETYLLARGLK